MFEQILKLESDVVWMYGDASSHAYPLAKIDTINQETGYLNEDSALSLIVYGVSILKWPGGIKYEQNKLIIWPMNGHPHYFALVTACKVRREKKEAITGLR